ncbi:glycosyltransferase family 2 protein [Neobacillus mesonae]|uniref:glycosyltransferase family 2 protein n=1 Tax=Neobacillus mesonae TaxID=1193713 RepID=UPI0025725E90|nr:glycosyltransferase family 2 protein [Neobacillus mesonae]
MPISFRVHARDLINSKKVVIKNNPTKFFNNLFKSKKKVSVVVAAYNAEKFISKTIESVINQSIGFENIQLIIVDDCSTDSTGTIINDYASRFKNICSVSLSENTGSPGTPRNVGIELASGEYITFIDADDWFSKNGIEKLVGILDETGDDYVVGKTIKVETGGESIIGEFASVKDRRSISPFDVRHFFYHMGPTAKMMKLSLLKENDIGFPNMKFAEDKLFFFDVFLAASKVSTTVEPVYYVNRTDTNQGSLTRTTNVIDKRRSDLKVIEYIQSKSLPSEKERRILNRLYEYDIVKTFDSMLFVNSDSKDDFISVLAKAIETTQNLQYDFLEDFETPLYKAAVELYMENRIDDFINLFIWLKKDKNKKYVIKDNLPYYEVPFFNDKYKYIRIPFLTRALDSYVIDNVYIQNIQIYGDDLNCLNHILIRDRNRIDNEIIIDFNRDGNFLQFKVDISRLNSLENSLFTVFIKYNNYKLLNIKRILKNQISFNNKNFEFYTTLANNLGLSIKPNSK